MVITIPNVVTFECLTFGDMLVVMHVAYLSSVMNVQLTYGKG